MSHGDIPLGHTPMKRHGPGCHPIATIVRRRPSIARPSHRFCVESQGACAGRPAPSQTMCVETDPLLRVEAFIIVRRYSYQTISGHHRIAAATKASLDGVPAWVLERGGADAKANIRAGKSSIHAEYKAIVEAEKQKERVDNGAGLPTISRLLMGEKLTRPLTAAGYFQMPRESGDGQHLRAAVQSAHGGCSVINATLWNGPNSRPASFMARSMVARFGPVALFRSISNLLIVEAARPVRSARSRMVHPRRARAARH
jgi:hypothetical protein